MSEENHQRCLALLRERTAIQRQIREPLARIQEIEREICALDQRRDESPTDRREDFARRLGFVAATVGT